MKRLYNNSVKKRTNIDGVLWREYYSRLRQFAEAGWGNRLTDPKDFAEFKMMESLRRNLGHFAGYKVQTIQEELRSLRKLPLKDFLKEGGKVMKRHNENYLEAELQTALAASNTASKWPAIQQRKFLYPNLRYETAGDERVRQSHAALDGLVYPVDDPFWDVYMPPNGYRCRCIVIQTDEPAKNGAFDFEPQNGFRQNAGKTARVFETDHPYFENQKSAKIAIERNAEKLRASWEKAEIELLAKVYTNSSFKLPQLNEPMNVTAKSIETAIASTHPEQAVKNALLSALAVIIPNLRFVNFDDKAWYYAIELFGKSFYFKITEQGEKLVLDNIIDKIS